MTLDAAGAPTGSLGTSGYPYLGLLVFFVTILAFSAWAFLPHARVPYFRVQQLKLRMYLYLHPGRGFATTADLLLNWNRFASFRESKRTRPAVSRWQRLRNANLHGIFLGHAQYFRGLWLPIQEHICMIGPPRAYKSGFFARSIASYRGSVVSTSTKGDMLALTAGIRQRRWGSPIYVFNPQGLGGNQARSNIRWNLVSGCRVPATAIRRAQALCEAIQLEGIQDPGYWAQQAARQMQAMLCAADLLGADFRIAHDWISDGQTEQAEKVLAEAGYLTWAKTLQQMRCGKAERMYETIRAMLGVATGFMDDPSLAECVLPGPGDAFDFEQFLAASGSLYLIGEQRSKSSPVAPLFCGIVTEVHFTACQVAASAKGRRLDPPLLLALDEVTQIVPIPLPEIVADSGGIGVQIMIAVHGIAQLCGRWGEKKARGILDCCNLMMNPGVQDPDTLRLAQELAGKEWFRIRHSDQRQELPIAPVEAIRQLPKKRSLIIRNRHAPVITRLPMGWRSLAYMRARLGRYADAVLAEVPSVAVVQGHAPLRAISADAQSASRPELGEPTSAGEITAPDSRDDAGQHAISGPASAHNNQGGRRMHSRLIRRRHPGDGKASHGGHPARRTSI